MEHIQEVYPKQPSPCNCLNTRRASRAVSQFYDKVLKPSGITVAQMSLLISLEKVEPISISELAKTMRIDRTTLNRNMKPLVDAGLIVVNPGQDSRTREVTMTAAGREAKAEAWALWKEAQRAIKEYLGEQDLATLTRLLAKLEALVP